MPLDETSGVYFEIHGSGPPVMLGMPWFASHGEILSAEAEPAFKAFVGVLAERYAVLAMDYPSIGKSRDLAPEKLTADRVCTDLLAVADAAGFERFAFVGYSWSAATALQLAGRTDRLSALAIGGWPPLDGPYEAIWAAARDRIGRVEPGAMRVLRSADQYRQWDTFYRSVVGHWDEAAVVGALRCPRMVYFGANGDLIEAGHSVPIASTIRRTRRTLEQQGWEVVEIEDRGHEVGVEVDIVAPLIRSFLDRVLGGTAGPVARGRAKLA
ncbi:alpha/beta hydrolase [Phenylobacterium sp.]|uniref:alpha/beta fold hydrolase n=1 Tax=Phenylobacterium sp. TaxID=1871053 RepID=UPI0026002491|nr:alpha/beta hydrolase [Phenylobacterium sp.]MCA6262290.1 alpha/beta hydrolase [Phenylobacterium sp.]